VKRTCTSKLSIMLGTPRKNLATMESAQGFLSNQKRAQQHSGLWLRVKEDVAERSEDHVVDGLWLLTPTFAGVLLLPLHVFLKMWKTGRPTAECRGFPCRNDARSERAFLMFRRHRYTFQPVPGAFVAVAASPFRARLLKKGEP